jgi:hypothetical protein
MGNHGGFEPPKVDGTIANTIEPQRHKEHGEGLVLVRSVALDSGGRGILGRGGERTGGELRLNHGKRGSARKGLGGRGENLEVWRFGGLFFGRGRTTPQNRVIMHGDQDGGRRGEALGVSRGDE